MFFHVNQGDFTKEVTLVWGLKDDLENVVTIAVCSAGLAQVQVEAGASEGPSSFLLWEGVLGSRVRQECREVEKGPQLSAGLSLRGGEVIKGFL